MLLYSDDLFKIILAVLAGGLIGLEREYHDKAAGFRTLIFICVGATLFTILSIRLAGDKDPTRIAAQIVTGIGFLGAGVIVRDSGKVLGLTTAAAIWLTSAVGMAIGGENYLLAIAVVVISLVVLMIFPNLERRIDRSNRVRQYQVLVRPVPESVDYIRSLFSQHGLRMRSFHVVKSDVQMRCTIEVVGSLDQHIQLERDLFDEPRIAEFGF